MVLGINVYSSLVFIGFAVYTFPPVISYVLVCYGHIMENLSGLLDVAIPGSLDKLKYYIIIAFVELERNRIGGLKRNSIISPPVKHQKPKGTWTRIRPSTERCSRIFRLQRRASDRRGRPCIEKNMMCMGSRSFCSIQNPQIKFRIALFSVMGRIAGG
ncbi:hypothetical protein BDZ97DRAFT_1226564 [Flammula alnicola]|nr:hypothetical protein BDZ97DRAFT_1226564 [Flammula alnicola]